MDTSPSHQASRDSCRLQWSHDLSAMDTNVFDFIFSEANMLQWSHDLSAMDTASSGRADVFCPGASMEPRPFSHGYLIVNLKAAVELAASMEPRPFSHGYAADAAVIPPPVSSFNGATTFQPWIRVRQNRRRRPVQGLQWSHDLSAMDTFAVFVRLEVSAVLQWSHDLSAMDTLSSLPHLRWHALLQWSHDLSAMDTRNAPDGNASQIRLASMEPRPFSHGYHLMILLFDACVGSLQWSHDLSAMDTELFSQLAAHR